ncbi:hypothetical protein PFISCL1PPCAC_5020, partial [Pristionchus fissidentatus]
LHSEWSTMSAISETHKERDGRSVLHAAVNPDTLLFTYAKDKHVLSFVVENTGDATQIFKIKTTASYLYRIRPVYFKLPVQERQEVNITYKGTDAGPIPMSGKDRITIVFAHALDAKKPTTELWEMHRPYANLSYAESREYVRVQFVDANGKLVVSDKRSQSGAAPPRSITMRPEPPVVAPQGKRTSGEKETDEKSNKSSDPSDYRNLELQNLFADIEEADPPSQVATAQLRSGTPRSAGTPKTARTQQSRLSRSPSPNSLLQQRDNNNNRKSPAQRGRSRDPIESILTSASKDAKAIVYVQYGKGGRSRNDDEGSTYEDEESRAKDEDSKVNDESTKRKKKAKEEDTRKRDDDTRREELLRKKNEETRKREDEERRKDDEEKKKKEDAEADEKSREAAKHTSNEEVQKQEDEENRPVIVTPRRRKLGPDGKYIDDISTSRLFVRS